MKQLLKATILAAALTLSLVPLAEAGRAVIDPNAKVSVAQQIASQGYVEIDGVLETETAPGPYLDGEHFVFWLREQTSGQAIRVRRYCGTEVNWEWLKNELYAAKGIFALGVYKTERGEFSADKVGWNK